MVVVHNGDKSGIVYGGSDDGAHKGGRGKLINNFIILYKSYLKMTNTTISLRLFHLMYMRLIRLDRMCNHMFKMQLNIE